MRQAKVNLAGCHSMRVGNYVFDGHIPVDAVKRVLKEKPVIRGLAVPGMPLGSPGMPGTKKEPLHVYYLSEAKPPKVYATYRGRMDRIKRVITFLSIATVMVASACSEPPPESVATVAAKKTPVSEKSFALWETPRPLPALAFEDANGQPRSLKDFRGKVVVLNIWATWCVPCRKEMPTLDNLQAKLGGPDLEVLALSIDQAGPEVVHKFFKEIGIKHLRPYIDSTAQTLDALNVIGLPTTLLVDRQGRELGRLIGEATWDSPKMLQFLQDIVERTKGDK